LPYGLATLLTKGATWEQPFKNQSLHKENIFDDIRSTIKFIIMVALKTLLAPKQYGLTHQLAL